MACTRVRDTAIDVLPAPVRQDALSAEALMDAFVKGDARAFERLYRLLSPRLGSTLTHMCGDSRLAEDLVQVVFMKLYRARGAYHSGMPVKPWVFAIARNALLDHRRSTRRRPECLSADGRIPDGAAMEAREPRGESDRVAVQELLQGLPASQREALFLLKVHGLSVSEVAALCGTSPASVKMRAQRAYRTLRQVLRGRVES